jgi:hypothetical protein
MYYINYEYITINNLLTFIQTLYLLSIDVTNVVYHIIIVGILEFAVIYYNNDCFYFSGYCSSFNPHTL